MRTRGESSSKTDLKAYSALTSGMVAKELRVRVLGDCLRDAFAFEMLKLEAGDRRFLLPWAPKEALRFGLLTEGRGRARGRRGVRLAMVIDKQYLLCLPVRSGGAKPELAAMALDPLYVSQTYMLLDNILRKEEPWPWKAWKVQETAIKHIIKTMVFSGVQKSVSRMRKQRDLDPCLGYYHQITSQAPEVREKL